MTQDQIDLIKSKGLNPDNYIILEESKSKLVIKHRRGYRWTIKKKRKRTVKQE